MFHPEFEVTSGFRQTQKRNSVLLTNLSRGLCFRTWTQRKTREWTDEVQKLITGDPGESNQSTFAIRCMVDRSTLIHFLH